MLQKASKRSHGSGPGGDLSAKPGYSVVIPVYNSAGVLIETVARVEEFFREHDLTYEVILVNDGSADTSWEVAKTLAQTNTRVLALDLTRNWGQHLALLCGLSEARGDYVVTIDDDLQNEPAEIACLIEAARSGGDLVFGRFRVKHATPFRRFGSAVMRSLIRRICAAPPGLHISNFRLMSRKTVDGILANATMRPNINCLAIMSAHNPTDTEVEHQPRRVGRSGYDLKRLAGLMLGTVFEYSLLPLFAAAAGGSKTNRRFDASLLIARKARCD